MSSPFIYHQGKRLYFEIPDGWNLLTFADLEHKRQPADVIELTRKSLNKPIGTSLIRDSLSPIDKIAVIIEDITRTSPKRPILEALLENLSNSNIPEENISIIIAVGTHRGLTSDEIEATFGRDLVKKYDISNHDCRARDLVPIGHLRTGATVKINRKAYEASFKIGIGSITPHPMNGFGGGGKIAFPGISDFDSILEHHMQWTFHGGTVLGKTEGNIFYDEVCAIASEAKLNFIINTILDQGDKVYDVVCGDPVKAHLAGIEKSKKIISQKFSCKSDVTIITSFPYSEGPQIVKPLMPASMVTKDGGCIILAADCKGNLPEAFVNSFEKFHSQYGGNLLKGVLGHFNDRRLIMAEGAVDFNMALGLTLAVQDKFKIILVSKDIEREKVEKMGFIFAEDLTEAFKISENIHPHPDVHVIPSGGIILPLV